MIEYVPRPLTEEVNVTQSSPLKRLVVLLACLLGVVMLAYVLAGILVDLLAGYVPASWERAMGDVFDAGFPDNAGDQRTRRLQALLQRLTPYMEEEDARLDYSIRVIESPTVNAMALPGGRIVVYSGLLGHVETDEEILFVLAHELGHFHHRDHLRRMGRGLITMLLYTLISGSGGDTPSGMMSVINNSMHMAYSRSQERDADLFAVALLFKATGSTRGAEAFMHRLEILERDAALPYFFSTHPSPAQRRQYVEEAGRALK